jgi:hypothetical protein
MVIERASIDCDDEDQRRKVERTIDKPLIEKTDCINKNTDRNQHEREQQIAIPNTLDHSLPPTQGL